MCGLVCRDVTSNSGLPTGSAYPTRDEDNNLLTTEFGLCVYKNHQVITMQVGPSCGAHIASSLPSLRWGQMQEPPGQQKG